MAKTSNRMPSPDPDRLWVDADYLTEHPDHIFVFGDNLKRVGKGGAAQYRDFPNTYGFITKKAPHRGDIAYYRPQEYYPVFMKELEKLTTQVTEKPDKTFLITRLGEGLANRYDIWDSIIKPHLEEWSYQHTNVKLIWY